MAELNSIREQLLEATAAIAKAIKLIVEMRNNENTMQGAGELLLQCWIDPSSYLVYLLWDPALGLKAEQARQTLKPQNLGLRTLAGGPSGPITHADALGGDGVSVEGVRDARKFRKLQIIVMDARPARQFERSMETLIATALGELSDRKDYGLSILWQLITEDPLMPHPGRASLIVFLARLYPYPPSITWCPSGFIFISTLTTNQNFGEPSRDNCEVIKT
ncbi:MAG: hypothetical protein M1834_001035 [Cirrosporium novae-zelandiae]|nr:MAG: hypothetical protein M1834_001035 [Cirrosporium novae-zelandiae]